MDNMTFGLQVKADRTGIVVYIPAGMSVCEICGELHERFFRSMYAFRKAGTVYMTFKGCVPNQRQAAEIIDYLNNLDEVNVHFVYRGESREALRKETPAISGDNGTCAVMLPESMQAVSPFYGLSERPYIFRGDIGRKQTLEIRGNVIILGDVARDAAVISGGSIIVIGELSGSATAGRRLPATSFILATHMFPSRLQIGKAVLREPVIKGADVPMIAANDNNSIRITCI